MPNSPDTLQRSSFDNLFDEILFHNMALSSTTWRRSAGWRFNFIELLSNSFQWQVFKALFRLVETILHEQSFGCCKETLNYAMFMRNVRFFTFKAVHAVGQWQCFVCQYLWKFHTWIHFYYAFFTLVNMGYILGFLVYRQFADHGRYVLCVPEFLRKIDLYIKLYHERLYKWTCAFCIWVSSFWIFF